MNIRLLVFVTIFAAAPMVASAQKKAPANQGPKRTLGEVQKVVQTISSDKTKLQAHCELGKLADQMIKAEEGNDNKAVDAIAAKAEALGRQIGPAYISIVEGLDEVGPNSAEGQQFATIFNSLKEKCR